MALLCLVIMQFSIILNNLFHTVVINLASNLSIACGSIGPRGCPQQIYSISARILASARKSHWPNKPKSHRQPDEPAETLSNKLIFPSLQRYHLCVSSST